MKRKFDPSRWREYEFLSVDNITEILNVSYWTAEKIIRQMPFVKIGKMYRVRSKAFAEWLKRQERRRA